MKKFIATLMLAGLSASLLTGCSISINKPGAAVTETAEEERTYKIVTTSFSAYDWARQITDGNSKFSISMIAKDEKTGEPAKESLPDIADSDLFIYNGGEEENWAEEYLGSHEGINALRLSDIATLQNVDNGHVLSTQNVKTSSEDETTDPYFWLSLKNAQSCVRVIARRIGTMDLDDMAEITSCADSYEDSLQNLSEMYAASIDSIDEKDRQVVLAGTNTFQYLMDEYGITCYSALPAGAESEEMTDEVVQKVVDKLNELKSKKILEQKTSGYNDMSGAVMTALGGDQVYLLPINDMSEITAEEAASETTTYMSIAQQNLYELQLALGIRSIQEEER